MNKEIEEIELRDILNDILTRSRQELLALTEQELASRWYFRWEDDRSIVWNIYQFAGALDSYKRDCRTWEEHHNGYSSVVERVRDKYLMPKIKAFYTTLREKDDVVYRSQVGDDQ